MLLLCETWLNPFSPDITIPGYELYWTDRQNKKGGGVAILVTTRLTHKLVKLKKTCSSYESIFVEVTINPGKKILRGSIYRPPNTNLDLFLEEYENTLHELKKINANVVLGLDHNLDFFES